jgi:GTPase KRas protein
VRAAASVSWRSSAWLAAPHAAAFARTKPWAKRFPQVVVGPGGVGKSCYTIQFIQEKFVEEYEPTVEDSFQRTANIDGELCKLDILDTAGQVHCLSAPAAIFVSPSYAFHASHALSQEEYAAMRDMYMRSGQGFLLIYDVTNRASFLEMPVFRNQILSAKDADNVPLVIVGNKCDLEDARDVSTADGVALANSYGAEFFEGSAKSRKNVDEAFFALVRACGCSAFSLSSFLLAHARASGSSNTRRQAAKSSGSSGKKVDSKPTRLLQACREEVLLTSMI